MECHFGLVTLCILKPGATLSEIAHGNLNELSYLHRISECNQQSGRRYLDFLVDGRKYGAIRTDHERTLAAFSQALVVNAAGVSVHPSLTTHAARTQAVADVVDTLARQGQVSGWRAEMFPVKNRFYDPPAFDLERAAVPFFGVRGYGVHLNGFVRTGRGIEMWVATRAHSKASFPGKLDNIVAGGIASDLGVFECLVKECAEEAGIDAITAGHARCTGLVSYCFDGARGLRPDVLFCYDLELPRSFAPTAVDGEHESFQRLPLGEVAALVRDTSAFKLNCNLVIIDFLVRHGCITAQDTDFEAIVAGLRR